MNFNKIIHIKKINLLNITFRRVIDDVVLNFLPQ